MNLEEFKHVRNRAIKSMDEKLLKEFFRKYLPYFNRKAMNDKGYYGGLHKARCEMWRTQNEQNLQLPEDEIVTEEEYQESREWLKKHKMSEKIN